MDRALASFPLPPLPLADMLRGAIVLACAFALILADKALPF
jgi:hypothetical protein